MRNTVKKAFDNRKLHYKQRGWILIEVTQKFKDILDGIQTYKSKYSQTNMHKQYMRG